MSTATPNAKAGTARHRRRPLNLRERKLLALALWFLAILTAATVVKNFKANSSTLSLLKATHAEQQTILDTRSAIDERLEKHAKRMESTQSLDISELQSLVDGFARSIRLYPETNTPKSDAKSSIQFLSVRLSFRNATMDRLLLFEDKLRTSRIPLTVTTARLDASRDGTVTATYEIATYRMNAKPATTPHQPYPRAPGKPPATASTPSRPQAPART